MLPVRVERVRQYIQEHFCEEISLESIAAACGMSKYYLCHVFKENMGVSVFNYLIWLRMEEARRLLHSGLPVTGRLTPLARDVLEGRA